jgi:hypothetical protein
VLKKVHLKVLLYNIADLQGSYQVGDILGSDYDGKDQFVSENWLVSRETTATIRLEREFFEQIIKLYPK